jgi:hypothetical protein
MNGSNIGTNDDVGHSDQRFLFCAQVDCAIEAHGIGIPIGSTKIPVSAGTIVVGLYERSNL